MANPIIMMSGLLLLAAALAGCSGGGGDDAGAASFSTETNVGNATVSGSASVGPNGAAGAGRVNGTEGNASASTSWSYDNRTGTLSGNGVPVAGQPIEKEETFTVPGNTSTLYLNLSAEGEELTLSLRAPGCDDSDCAEETKTQSGKASLQLSNPETGPYVAVLQLEGTGPVESDYILEIATLSPGSAS